MKIVKYVFLLLLLAVVAVTVFIATQEGKYDIKEERVIKAPKAVLYNYINEYKNWENLGILTGSDTTAVFTYPGNSSGNGAIMSWKKDSSTGKVETIKLSENDSIIQKAVIDNLNSDISWAFKDSLKNTRVTVRIKGDMSFSEKANALLRGGGNVNKVMESSLKKGLENLDNFLINELAVNKVEVKGLVSKTAAFYLGHAITSKIEDINKRSAETFPKLMDFMKKNKIIKKGSPFILYRNYNKTEGTASYVVCIPIKEEMFTSPGSEYEGGKYVAFNALKTTLKGDYSHLPKAWDAAHKYITEKALQENTTGTYIELYSKGVLKSKRPSEWITDLYIPIGPPTVMPVMDSIPSPAMVPAIKPATTMQPVTGGIRTPEATAASNMPAKPQTGATTTKPAAAGTKPAGTKPAGTKPAGTVTGTKQSSTTGTGTKPASTTAKPAPKANGATSVGTTGTTAKPTPKPVTPKPAATEKPATQPTTTP